jgi:hypothetical protein
MNIRGPTFFFSGSFSCAFSSAGTVFLDDLPLRLALAGDAPAATSDTEDGGGQQMQRHQPSSSPAASAVPPLPRALCSPNPVLPLGLALADGAPAATSDTEDGWGQQMQRLR